MSEDNLTIVAAGVAFFAFVAVVPALAATIAIYALFADAGRLALHLEVLAQVVPPEVMPLLREQISRIAQDDRAAGISAVLGLAVALFSSAKGIKALILGLNIAYDEREKRGFIRLNATAILITFCAIVGLIVIVTLVTTVPVLLGTLGLNTGSERLLSMLRWPMLFVIFMSSLAVLYRVGPCREAAQWRWLSWGAAAASLLWILASAAFSFYVSRFASFQETYGSLGAIVVFLLWLFLSAFIMLFGAELNAEMERQTKKDTTGGEPMPLGERGAYAADTVGPGRPASKQSEKRRSPQRQDIRS